MARTLERYRHATDAAPAGTELALVISTYLDASQRDHPATGCLIPALAADVARSPEEVSTAFTEGLQNLLQYVGSLLPHKDGPQPQDEALALVSGLVGALLLARATHDPELRERLLQANHDFLTRTFAPDPA
jgi:TetR/AcrR family transcriptional repressor of nem operon